MRESSCHIILRGSSQGPNYDATHIDSCSENILTEYYCRYVYDYYNDDWIAREVINYNCLSEGKVCVGGACVLGGECKLEATICNATKTIYRMVEDYYWVDFDQECNLHCENLQTIACEGDISYYSGCGTPTTASYIGGSLIDSSLICREGEGGCQIDKYDLTCECISNQQYLEEVGSTSTSTSDPTCSDGIQNKDEAEVDCGGVGDDSDVDVTCEDSDGNLNVEEQIYQYGTIGDEEDTCYNSTAVRELSCENPYQIRPEGMFMMDRSEEGVEFYTMSIHCPADAPVCQNGACVVEGTTSCTESDNGANDIHIKSSCTDLTKTVEDKCYNKPYDMYETICTQNDICANKPMSCPTGEVCQDGACVVERRNIWEQYTTCETGVPAYTWCKDTNSCVSLTNGCSNTINHDSDCTSQECDFEVYDWTDLGITIENVGRYLKTIQSECGLTFEFGNVLETLPSGYNFNIQNRRVVIVLNITSDNPNFGATLNLALNESEFKWPLENITIYVEESKTDWSPIVDKEIIATTTEKVYDYNFDTDHFSLFLITEPDYCENNDFEADYFEECDGSTNCNP